MASADLRVSILIPYFKQPESAQTLVETLLRVEEEGLLIEEILLIADGDTPPELPDESKLKLIYREKNRGLSFTRNQLMEESKAPIVLFFDADAIPMEGFFNTFVQSWNRKDFFAGREADSPSEGLWNTYRRHFFCQTHGEKDIQNVSFFMGLCFGGPRSLFEKVGEFDLFMGNFGEDIDFSFRAIHSGFQIQYLAGLRVYHDRHDTFKSLINMIRNHSKGQIYGHLKNNSSIIKVIVESLRWIPVSTISALKRHRSPLLSCVSVFLGFYALACRLLAAIEYSGE